MLCSTLRRIASSGPGLKDFVGSRQSKPSHAACAALFRRRASRACSLPRDGRAAGSVLPPLCEIDVDELHPRRHPLAVDGQDDVARFQSGLFGAIAGDTRVTTGLASGSDADVARSRTCPRRPAARRVTVLAVAQQRHADVAVGPPDDRSRAPAPSTWRSRRPPTVIMRSPRMRPACSAGESGTTARRSAGSSRYTCTAAPCASTNAVHHHRQEDVHRRPGEEDLETLPLGLGQELVGMARARIFRVLAGHLHVAAERNRADAVLGVAARAPSESSGRSRAKTSARGRRAAVPPGNAPARGRRSGRRARTETPEASSTSRNLRLLILTRAAISRA